MAGIFTRKVIQSIMNDENLTPEERTDQVFSLYGRAVDDGYITKSAADAALKSALEEAKASYKPPEINIKESEEYKALLNDFNNYKTKQSARASEDFKGVKGKFFDTVYDSLDHSEKHKPYSEQLTELKANYAEYFEAEPEAEKSNLPQFGGETKGQLPTGKGQSFGDFWGFKK